MTIKFVRKSSIFANILSLLFVLISLIVVFVLNSYYLFLNESYFLLNWPEGTKVLLVVSPLLMWYFVIRSRGVRSLDGNCYIVYSNAYVKEVYGISGNEFAVKFTIKDNELVECNDDVNYIDVNVKFCDMSNVNNIYDVHLSDISRDYCYAISAMKVDMCYNDLKLSIDMSNASSYDIKLIYKSMEQAVVDIMNTAIKEYKLIKSNSLE
jgi:hypothetical protein